MRRARLARVTSTRACGRQGTRETRDGANECCPPNTCSPDKLNDNQKQLVYEWVKANIQYLFRAAAFEEGFEKPCISTSRCVLKDADCVRIVSAVCKDEGVRRFFCFSTVSNATFRVLQSVLHGSATKKKMCVECSGHDKHCGHRTVMKMARSKTRHHSRQHESETAASEGSVKNFIGNVRAKIAGSESEYWRIINEASILDQGFDRLEEYVREVTKKKNMIQAKQLAKTLDARVLHGAHFEQRYYDKFNLRRRNWFKIMHQNDSRLLAKWSISHVVANRLGLYPCERELYHCQMIPTDGCHGFWNARFLFAGVPGNGCFQGVALDTVLAKVWKASMKHENTGAENTGSCGSSHWKCKLEKLQVGEEQWNRYVARHDYSLSAFHDDSCCRFRPDEHIHLECIPCYEPLKERSVLLHPL